MAYDRVNWINEAQGTTTPLNAENLNTMDAGIADVDERVTALEEGGSGTSDYTELSNKPKINNVELTGNKTSADLGLADADDIPTKTSDLTNDSNFVTDASYVHTDNNYTSTEKTKLSGLESVSWQQNTTSGTKIAEINIGGTKTDVYAPTSGGGGGGGASSWSELSDKPFNSLDNDTVYNESGVLKAKQYSNIVVSTLLADNNEIEITSGLFINDSALFTPLFEPTELDSKGNYKVLTCTHEIVDTTLGKITLTVSEAPTVNTRVAIQITEF